MIVAMNRDGQLKVEAITDEFVTLDTKTDVMAKFDAVVSGEGMDDGYKVREENVNITEKKKGGDKEDDNKKKGKKRASTSSTTPKPKKRKVSVSKKK